MAKQASSSKERLEDIFQDEIIKAFVNTTSFEKFARSKYGLCLDQAVIQTIAENHGDKVEDRKLQMLFKWREIQGKTATVANIRSLSKKYMEKDNPSDLGVKRNSNLTTPNKFLQSSETDGEPVRKASRNDLPSTSFITQAVPGNEAVQQRKCELNLDNNNQRSSVSRPAVQQETQQQLANSTSQVNPRWKQIEGTEIEYDQASRYKEFSKVFNARRKSGAKVQETVVKFLTDFNNEDKATMKKYQKREIENHWDTHFHDNVVTYLQSGVCKYEEKDAIFILMEKCDEKTLSERIKEGSMPYITRAKTVKFIAQGLQHLKEKKILHRDLKPQNILYKGDVGIISDFGLSKKISPEKSHTYQSIPYLGTLGWGAPETYSDDANNSFAADIYSAGLVFYFALTNGKHPYGNEPIRQAYINRDWDCNLKPLYDTPDGIVAHDLISLMLSRDPKDRPTIEEVLKHPFFWDVTTKKTFYYDICSTSEFHDEKITESRIFSSQNKKYLKKNEIKNSGPTFYYWNKVEAEKIEWIGKLPLIDAEIKYIKDNFVKGKSPNITVQKDVIKGFAKNRPDSVTSMVCFIRNKFEHSGEDKGKGRIDLTDEQLWEFFNSRYPYLFIYTYYASKEYCETKPASDPDNLKKYF